MRSIPKNESIFRRHEISRESPASIGTTLCGPASNPIPSPNQKSPRVSVANRWEVHQKGSQENAFVTLGYVGSRLVYEIAVYEFKIGREKPLIIAVRSHRGLFSAFNGICQ